MVSRVQGDVVKLCDKRDGCLDGGIRQVTVGCSWSTVWEVKCGCNIAVGGWASKAATAIASLSNVGSRTQSRVECTTALLAIRILSARGGNKSSSTTVRRSLSGKSNESDDRGDDAGRELHDCKG